MEDKDQPINDKAMKMFENEIEKVGLNAEVLGTIVKEFSRISTSANHEQIHAILSLLESLHMACQIQHALITAREGGEHV